MRLRAVTLSCCLWYMKGLMELAAPTAGLATGRSEECDIDGPRLTFVGKPLPGIA